VGAAIYWSGFGLHGSIFGSISGQRVFFFERARRTRVAFPGSATDRAEAERDRERAMDKPL